MSSEGNIASLGGKGSTGKLPGGSKEGIKDRIKTWFHLSREDDTDNPPLGSSRSSSLKRLCGPSSYSSWNALQDLDHMNDLSVRLNALRTLESSISTRNLENYVVEEIWFRFQDLLYVEEPGDSKSEISQLQALHFLQILLKYQVDQLEKMRPVVFDGILQIYNDCSNGERELDSSKIKSNLFFCLKNLTKDGLTVSGFGEKVPTFLQRWTNEVLAKKKENEELHLVTFLQFVQSVIRYNASFWEEEHLCELIHQLCVHACRSKEVKEVETCLALLDTILCYSLLPRPMLLMVMTTLCKLVNRQQLCKQCWRLTRSIFGSHLGNGAVHVLINFLQASEAYPDANVIRGAVYFIGMGFWGSQRLDQLRHRPAAVLPAFQSALAIRNKIVTYEVLLSLQRLIQKYGKDLQLVTWHIVLDLLETVVLSLEESWLSPAAERQEIDTLNDILNHIEDLHESNSFGGSSEQFFNLIEIFSRQRPEKSILRLLSYRSKAINPLKSSWLPDLRKLLEAYYCEDARCSIRIKALSILRNVYTEQHHLYGREIVETVALPLLKNVSKENNAEIQAITINFLCDVAKFWYDAECFPYVIDERAERPTDLFFSVVSLVEDFVNNTFSSVFKESPNCEGTGASEAVHQYFDNLEKAVCGILEILEKKWCSWPPSHSFHLLKLLLDHVLINYEEGGVGYLGGSVRNTIFQSLLQLRGDPSTGRLGIFFSYMEAEKEMELSPYALCSEGKDEKEKGETRRFKWDRLGEAAVACIQKEMWYPTLRTFFKHLPGLLKNRVLILTSPGHISQICSMLVALTGDPHRAGKLYNAPEHFTQSELNDIVCSSLAPLVSYKNDLDAGLQKKLLMGIQTCLVSEKSTASVIATISCALEFSDSLGPMSRDLLRRLSELPATPKIVIPVMELLSVFLRLKKLLEYFTEKHYQLVCDILLPCTDPAKFTTFIVSLAFQLTWRWFLAVPLKHRGNMACYIRKKIEDVGKKNSDESYKLLSSQMKATLEEFLNHYTFTDNAPKAGHNRVVENLMEKHGRSKVWFLGNKIITVKTALPGGGSTENLCNDCRNYLRRNHSETKVYFGKTGYPMEKGVVEGELTDFQTKRRRHASAAQVQGKVTQGPPSPFVTSMDDSFITTNQDLETFYEHRSVRFGDEFQEGEEPGDKMPLPICPCWCRGFSVIDIRHSFGRISWLLKISDGNLNPMSCGILRTAVLSLEESAFEENLPPQPSPFNEMPRNFSDNFLTMTIDSELDGKGGSGEETILSRNSSISVKSGKSFAAEKHSSEFDSETEKRGSTLSCNTPTSTTSSDYFSVRSQTQQTSASTGPLSIDPSWVFVQIFGVGAKGSEKALPEKSPALVRAIKTLDWILPEETHKIGVVYAGPRQTKEEEILGNLYGSERYGRFLEGLGNLISLKDSDPNLTFLGGLNTDGSNGLFTYYWEDQITQVVFHVSSLMPNLDNDPSFNRKKMHIGNDHVVIVFNETGKPFKLGIMKGELSYVIIVVTPEDADTLYVKLLAKDEITRWLTMKSAVMSDAECPLLCRQLAMRADHSAKIWLAQEQSDQPFLSQSLERLREIQKIKEKFQGSRSV